MRGDRYRQCLPRRSDLCPIPKISDIFSSGGDVRFTARIKPSSSRNDGRAFLLRCFLFVASASGETSVTLDDEFVRPMAAHRASRESKSVDLQPCEILPRRDVFTHDRFHGISDPEHWFLDCVTCIEM